MRAATHWDRITDDTGRVIDYIHGDEGTGVRLESIKDPRATYPARRIIAADNSAHEPSHVEDIKADDLVAPVPGLTVYGRHKFDRPSLQQALAIDGPAARAIIADCVRHGRGYEHSLIFEAARKRLGLTQTELGLHLDLANANPDAAKRAANANRTVRRWEHDGAPVMAALALRWLCYRAGVLDKPCGAA